MTPLGVYVHFPFCRRKCAYCDFNSRVGAEDERSLYLRALCAEIARNPGDTCSEVATVYFGGGTPTLYPPEALAEVLVALRGALHVAADAEITCEANPGTVTASSLRALRQAGFTRLSLGVQSLNDAELRLLGRVHTAEEARQAIHDAYAAGFDNVSVDLMRGLPGQCLREWDATLSGTLALAPKHISVYGLTLENGTPLRERVLAGDLPQPRGSASPHWVRWTVARLAEGGYARYEISNYSQPGYECRHNLIYWHNEEYVGLGAGAWSYRGGERSRNIADPLRYAEAVHAGNGAVEQSERVSPAQALGETVMLGLRLTKGVEIASLDRRYGVDFLGAFRERIGPLVDAGLAVLEDGYLRLTPAGLLVQSAVAVEFLP